MSMVKLWFNRVRACNGVVVFTRRGVESVQSAWSKSVIKSTTEARAFWW